MPTYSKPEIVLGLHLGHDRCAALVKDGHILAAIAEERLDRVKHSPADLLPLLSIDYIFEIASISPADVTDIGVTFGGNILYEDVKRDWLKTIQEHFSIPEKRIHVVGHHMAHAYSAYYTSPFDTCAIVVADGCGDVLPCGAAEAESYYWARNGVIENIYDRPQRLPKKYGSPFTGFRSDYMPANETDLPISIGRKYEQLTKLIGFSFGQAGKTMGLAPYGERLVEFKPQTYGMEHSLCRSDYLEQLHELYLQSGIPYARFVYNNKHKIAYDIQQIAEILILESLREFSQKVDTGNLCLAGGVFLNCVANKKIADAQYFENIHIMPATGDDGQAIGAAYYVYRMNGGSHRNRRLKFLPYLGKRYTSDNCLEAIKKLGYFGVRYDNTAELIDALANRLVRNEVIGVLQGRTEVGPRALGNRSIIASPFRAETRDYINEHIKYREDFRPFAPMVTIEGVRKYFEIERESPYMLYTCMVKEAFRERLPAITHVDGSARMQTVSKEDNPFAHRLLTRFEELTGFPILVNTSFNTAFEPMVESPEDALRTLTNSALNAVVLENLIVDGSNGKTVS